MLKKSPILDPSLRNLAFILRHREWWPEGFEWDYRYCETCAIGLCEEIYGTTPGMMPDYIGDYDCERYHDIFSTPVSFFRHPLTSRVKRLRMVTPEMVADRIDEYLANG